MKRLIIRSRPGSTLLVVVGVFYVISAAVVLGWYVVDVWGAAALTDRVMQLVLVLCGAAGVWFVVVGLENLRPDALRVSRGRRRVAATQS